MLDLFTVAEPAWTAEAICGARGFSQPTGYRYIREFVTAGLLLRVSGGRYMLGPRIISLDYEIRRADPVLRAALPAMRAVALRTGCDCLLSALFGEQVLDTHREPGADTLALAYSRGRPRPMFVGAAPKVILAARPTAWLKTLYESRVAEIEAAGMGESWPSFRAALRRVRRDGFAISRGELEPELSAIAVPVSTGIPESTASIALVTSRARFDLFNERLLVQILQQAATEISA